MNREELNNIEVRPTGRGRPVNKNTARTRSAVIRHLSSRLEDGNKDNFSARDVASATKIGRAKVALALRWLDHLHGAVVPVDTTHQERRARPELVYALVANAKQTANRVWADRARQQAEEKAAEEEAEAAANDSDNNSQESEENADSEAEQEDQRQAA